MQHFLIQVVKSIINTSIVATKLINHAHCVTKETFITYRKVNLI